MRKFVIACLFLAFVVIALIWVVIQPLAYLPHEKITIRVPYSFSDTPDSMIPMGETLAHPQTPNGHPGIDFGWDSGTAHEVLSSSDGTVTKITIGESDAGKYDVEVSSGVYVLRYKEMEGINQDLKISSHVKAGDIIGYVGKYCDQAHCWFNLHWELASSSIILDRWCPVNYLDAESRNSIENLWNEVPSDNQFKSKFREICSGDFMNKSEV